MKTPLVLLASLLLPPLATLHSAETPLPADFKATLLTVVTRHLDLLLKKRGQRYTGSCENGTVLSYSTSERHSGNARAFRYAFFEDHVEEAAKLPLEAPKSSGERTLPRPAREM